MKGVRNPVQVQDAGENGTIQQSGESENLFQGAVIPQHGSLDVTSLGQASNHEVTLLFAMATYLSGQLACHQQNVTQFHKAECRIFIPTSKPNDQNVQEDSIQNPNTVDL